MKLLIYILLLYFIEAFEFFGSIPLLKGCHYFFLVLSLGAYAYYMLFKKISIVAIFIGLYSFVFPIYAAYQSHEIFGQPFFMGFASLRYLWFILFGFFLYNIRYDFNLLLSQINKINLIVAITSIVAFFFFGINHVNIQQYMVNTDALEIIKSEDMLRGFKLTVCSDLMIISYVFYMIRFIKSPARKENFLPFFILMVYLLFVNKGRQPLAMLGVIYAISYIKMKGFTAKRLILGILPLIGVIVFQNYYDTLVESVFEAVKWEQSKDFSTLARVNSVKAVTPYIQKNPLFGFGNLSVHFKDEGFHTYFGGAFYVADIGIWGALARGGIVLMIIYFGLYYNLYKKTADILDGNIRIFYRYMMLAFIILLVFLHNDTLFDNGCLRIALVFYPLFGCVNPNLFFKNSSLSNGCIHNHC